MCSASNSHNESDKSFEMNEIMRVDRFRVHDG